MKFFCCFQRKNNTAEQITQQQTAISTGFETLRSLSGYSRVIIIWGIIMLIVLWSFAAYQISSEYNRAITEASRETMNLGIAFEEHVRRIISDVDKDLVSIKHAYEAEGLGSPIVSYNMQPLLPAANESRNLQAIFDEQGTIVHANFWEAVGKNEANMKHFLVHQNSVSDKLIIGAPIIGQTCKKQTIPLTRRINKPDGSFGGVVYIGLKVDYFLDFYQKMNLGQNQLIALVGLDGIVRARQSGNNLEIGQDVIGSLLWESVRDYPCGTYIANDFLDGISRIVSYRAMPDYPLIFTIGKATKEALADYERSRKNYVLGTSLASLFIILVCSLLIDRGVKQRKHNMSLQRLVEDRTQELTAQVTKTKEIAAELAAIFESIGDPFFVLDNEWRLTYINKEAMQSADLRLSDMHTGQNIWELFPDLIGSELYQKFYAAVTTRIPIHTAFKSAISNTVFDARLFPYADGLIAYFRDITEQKKYETELAHFDRLNIVGEMAAGIGHEVRNPMTTVRGYLQMLQSKKDFAGYQEHFGMMIEEIDRANSIISEFLSLAKEKAVEMKKGNLNNVIQSLLPLLQADAFSRGHQIQVDSGTIADNEFDEKEMRQLILNLVRNGFEAMENSGEVIIRTFQRGDSVILEVEDTGSGIPDSVMEKLGTPFVTTKESGTGLGLPVCYRIAARHGARIDVATGPGGTRFTVVFV